MIISTILYAGMVAFGLLAFMTGIKIIRRQKANLTYTDRRNNEKTNIQINGMSALIWGITAIGAGGMIVGIGISGIYNASDNLFSHCLIGLFAFGIIGVLGWNLSLFVHNATQK